MRNFILGVVFASAIAIAAIINSKPVQTKDNGAQGCDSNKCCGRDSLCRPVGGGRGGPYISSFDKLLRDYQIECKVNGLELWDGLRYIGFVKWTGKENPLDSLIILDNQ